jgi:CheY-like chemotaxis protein
MAAHDPKMVLVVEDELLVRVVTSQTLAEAGYLILEAGTGDEALRIITAGAPLSAVVTDIEMPGALDGLELAKAIETRWPEIAIVIISGRRLPAPDELPPKAVFLPKPYSPGRLIAAVGAAL